MNTNANITIFNRRYNPVTRSDEWQRTQIYGVSWYGGQAVTVSDNGLMAADTYRVRIPLYSAPKEKTFVTPEEYAGLAKDTLSSCWTLQNGDIVARGLLDADIAQPKQIPTEHFIITGWSDDRRGSSTSQHWKVEGK